MPSRILILVVAALVFGFIAPAELRAQEDRLDRYLDRAERAVERGQWKRARRYLEKIVALDGADDEIEGQLLLALRATGDWKKLLDLAERRAGAQPKSLARVVDLIEVLLLLGRDDEALKTIDAFEGKESGGFLLESFRANIHRDRGRDQKASAIYEKLVDRAKEVVVRGAADLVGLARAYRSYRHGGDYAEEALIAAQKADPEYLEARTALAEVYMRAKEDPPSAMKELQLALEKRPRWPEYLVLRAEGLDLWIGQREGEKRQAIDQALAVNAKLPAALFMRGMRELGNGDWDGAEATFAAALAVNPGHRRSLAGHAAVAYLTGRDAVFAAREKRVFERDPTYGSLYRIVAEALNSRRRWPEAFAMMEKAVAKDAEDSRSWDDLARYAFYIGEEKRGREALKKANDLVRYGQVWRNNIASVMALLEKEYETIKTPHYVLKLHENDRAPLEKLFVSSIEGSWAEFEKRYGFTPQNPVIFEVFRRSKDFSVRTMGTKGLPALGVCFGTTVAMDSPRARRPGTYNWEATAHHEIAHVFTLQLSRGRVPRWLTEGISSWEERRRDESWGRDMMTLLHDRFAAVELLKVLEFDAAFGTPLIGFAYFQGGLVAEWMEKTWGVEKVVEVLKAYGDDRRTAEILREVLNTSPREFDSGFRDFVGKLLAPMRRIPTWSDEAMERFAAAAEKGENVAENRIRLAWGYFRRGSDVDTGAQLDLLQKAEVEDPRIELLHGFRALQNKRMKLAREKFALVEKAGFEDFDLFATLAGFAEEEGDDERAIAMWRRAQECHPWVALPQQSPALALARLAKGGGDLAEWARWTRIYCDLVDTALPPRIQLIDYHVERGELEAALGLYLEIERLVPLNAGLRLRRAKLHRMMDDDTASRLQLLIAVSLKLEPPQEIEARLELGKSFLKVGDGDEAAYHLTRVLDLDPGNAEAKTLLKRADLDSQEDR
jgi:tetratricopeptide (TPR) repeat protein